MKMKKIIISTIVFALVALSADICSVWAQNDKQNFPYTGIVTENDVNLRSGPGLNFEILKKVGKDDLVLVNEEAYGWCKVKLPAKSSAYIHREYLMLSNRLAGKVTADKVNIRAGANTTFNVIGQLNKDDFVEIIAEENDWYQIYPRDNCFAWIHKDFVKQKGPASLYLKPEKERQMPLDLLLEAEGFESEQHAKQDAIKKENEAALAETPAVGQESAETPQGEVQTISAAKEDSKNSEKAAKPIPAIDTAAILQKYQLIVRDYQESEEAKIAEEHIAQIKSSLPQEDAEKTGEKAAAKNLTPPADQAPIASGKVMDVGRMFKRKGTHKLIDKDKKAIYFLTSENLNLNEYVYRQVEIWGTISSPDEKIPTIVVDFIKKLD